MDQCESHKHISVQKGIKKCVSLQKGINKHITVCGDYSSTVAPDAPTLQAPTTGDKENEISLGFNGTNSRVDLGSPAALDFIGAFTIEGWIYPNNLDGGFEVVFTKGKTASSAGDSLSGSYNINVLGGSNVLRMTIAQTTSIRAFVQTGSIPLNTWTHFAFTWDGTIEENNLKVYLNGELENQSSQTDVSSLFVSPRDVYIGADPHRLTDSRMFWDGMIDELRVWNYDRSAEQIADSYRRMLLGSETDLLGYWNAEDQAADVTDLSPNGNDGTRTFITYESNTAWNNNRVFTWDEVVGVDGYNLYASIDGGGFVKQNDELIVGLTSTLVNPVDGVYQVYVVAVLEGLESDPSNIVDFTVP